MEQILINFTHQSGDCRKLDIWVLQNDLQSTADNQNTEKEEISCFFPFPLRPLPQWYDTDDTVYYEDLGVQYISEKKVLTVNQLILIFLYLSFFVKYFWYVRGVRHEKAKLLEGINKSVWK